MHNALKDRGFPRALQRQFPAVEIFRNSFGNVLRLGAFTVVERALSVLRRGRMGSMHVVARRSP